MWRCRVAVHVMYADIPEAGSLRSLACPAIRSFADAHGRMLVVCEDGVEEIFLLLSTFPWVEDELYSPATPRDDIDW